MPENYLAPFQTKQLNQIVIPGSHDAGIYGLDKDNVKTQKLDIGEQAMAGVRFFDMRIATSKSGIGPSASYEQRSYHLDGKLVKDNSHAIRRHLPGGEKDVKSHQNVSAFGGWGADTLGEMLLQAKAFVDTHPTEFLMMKFSKCYNLGNVVAKCLEVLQGSQFKSRTVCNLNETTVSVLAGHVITLFDPKELAKLKLDYASGDYDGCLTFKELFDKKSNIPRAYEQHYDGLQYFGKFSSTDNIRKNTAKQTAMMVAGAACDPNAVGMMYWTTTGMFGSIEDRNKEMWKGPNRQALKDTWGTGLRTAIEAQMGRDFPNVTQYANSYTPIFGNRSTWKFFMPNIVMMDFASPRKCSTISRLNDVTNNEIQSMVNAGLLS